MKEEFREEERRIDYLRDMRSGLLGDIIRETERDMKATLREVERKYLAQIANIHKAERKMLKEKKERARRK